MQGRKSRNDVQRGKDGGVHRQDDGVSTLFEPAKFVHKTCTRTHTLTGANIHAVRYSICIHDMMMSRKPRALFHMMMMMMMMRRRRRTTKMKMKMKMKMKKKMKMKMKKKKKKKKKKMKNNNKMMMMTTTKTAPTSTMFMTMMTTKMAMECNRQLRQFQNY